MTPADTWLQPKTGIVTNVETTESDATDDPMEEPPIFKLNEDCLIELLKHCDGEMLLDLSETCKYFNELVNEHGFSRLRTLTLHVPFESDSKPLAKTRKILQKVGRKITNLYVYWPTDDQKERDYKNLNRFVQKVNQYIGTRLQSLHLIDTDDEELFTFNLSNLRTLKIKSTDRDHTLEFYQRECPNLTKVSYFKIFKNLKLRRPWVELQIFKFDFRKDQDLIEISLRMINLQKLTIHRCYFLKPTSLNPLLSLEHLTKLHLIDISHDEINLILESLAAFVRLKELKLTAGYFNRSQGDRDIEQNLIVDLAKRIRNLEHMHFSDFKLEASTVLRFVEFAHHLKKLHIHDPLSIEKPVTHSQVMDLVTVLKFSQNRQHREPLQIFLDSHWMYDMTLDNNHIKQYLVVNYDCKHSRY